MGGSDLVVRGATLLDRRCADVWVRGGALAAVTPPGLDVPEGTGELDAAGRVLLPAFADLHTHLDKARTLPAAESLDVPRDEARIRVAAERTRRIKLGRTEEQVRATAVRVVGDLVARGTTAVRTHADVDLSVGLRGVRALLDVRRRVADLADVQVTVLPTEPGWRHGGEALALIEEAASLDGVQALGGATSFDPDPVGYTDAVLALARRHGLDVDLHVDECDDPTELTLEHVAERTIEVGYEGRVVAGHCSSLGIARTSDAARIAAKVAAAGITVVAMPLTNLYLLGAVGGEPRTRGMTNVRALFEAGARVAVASDNMEDPFMPFGCGDLLQTAALAGAVGQCGSPLDRRRLVDAVTVVPRQAMAGWRGAVGLEPGATGDLVLLDLDDPDRLLAAQPGRAAVIRRGRIVAGHAAAAPRW
jgi:cytosine/creatinine deaminase